MSLEGSLQTVALPEVLHLLADTSKSGELRISGSRTEGRLWFADGELTAFQSDRCDEAVDALFDLLRMEDGVFVFEAGVDRPDDAVHPRSAPDEMEADRADIRPLLERAEARLVEWHEIVAVVPSLAHRVELAPEAPQGGVVLDAGQWSLVVAIGEGRSVQDVLDRVQLPEFAGCKALKELVGTGVAGLPTEAAAAEPDGPDESDKPEPHDVPSAELGEVSVTAAAAESGESNEETTPDPDLPFVAADDESPDEPDALADRGPWPVEELAGLDPCDWRDEAPAAPGHADPDVGDETPDHAEPDDQPAAVRPAGEPGAVGYDSAGDAPGEDGDFEGDEPINRGLLLKFLSSVRS